MSKMRKITSYFLATLSALVVGFGTVNTASAAIEWVTAVDCYSHPTGATVCKITWWHGGSDYIVF